MPSSSLGVSGVRCSARYGLHLSRANQSASAWVGCSPGAVAGVDQWDAQVLEDLLGRIRLGVAHDEQVGIGVEHLADVRQGLPLGLSGGAAVGDRDHLAVEAEDRALEARPRPGRGLEECSHHDLAVQRVVWPDLDLLEDRREFAELGHLVEGELAASRTFCPSNSWRVAKLTGLWAKRFEGLGADGMGAFGRFNAARRGSPAGLLQIVWRSWFGVFGLAGSSGYHKSAFHPVTDQQRDERQCTEGRPDECEQDQELEESWWKH